MSNADQFDSLSAEHRLLVMAASDATTVQGVTVIGAPPPFDPPEPDPPSGGDGGGGGGSPSADPVAVDWASNHVRDTLNNDLSKAELTRIQDILTKLYQEAHENPDTTVVLGNGQTETLGQIFDQVDRTTLTLQVDNTGPNGALTSYPSTTNPSITIDPTNPNVENWKAWYGDQGEDYVISHEYGHSIDEQSGFTGEGPADTTGYDLAQALGFPDIASAPH